MPLMPTRKRRYAVLAAALLAVAAGYLAWPALRSLLHAPMPGNSESAAARQGLRPMAPARAAQKQDLKKIVLGAEDRDFIQRLREKFAGRMQSKHAQVKAIEQLLAYLMARYPDDWQDRVYGFLQALFPDLADALYDKFQRLMRYNDWLRGNRAVLMKMAAGDRRQALWAARREAFGEEAEEIFAAQRRSEQVQDALVALDSAQGVPLDRKLSVFLDAIHEAYGPDASALLQNRQTELMNRFLSVNSVQGDLHAMTPAERRDALRAIRGAMGLDEAALARWDQLDRQRDQNWDAGQRYMQERERIQSQYEGEEEQQELRRLQDRSFGADAETIRNEEEAGFYRYGSPRRFGRE